MATDNRVPGIQLRADEEVVVIVKPHWVVFVRLANILIIPLIWQFLSWKNTVYVLTTQRVIEEAGVISASQVSVQLDKIQDAQFLSAGILGRIMGVGHVMVQTAGSASNINMQAIPQPRQICDRIQNEIAAAKKRDLMQMAQAMKTEAVAR